KAGAKKENDGVVAFVQETMAQFGLGTDQGKPNDKQGPSGLVKPDQIPAARTDARGMTVGDLIKDVPVAQGKDIKQIERGQLTDVDLGDGRKYQIYVPKNAKEPMPVMMLLHSASGSAADGLMSKESGMNKLAEEKGFAVVYPLAKTHGALFGMTDVATW